MDIFSGNKMLWRIGVAMGAELRRDELGEAEYTSWEVVEVVGKLAVSKLEKCARKLIIVFY